MSIRYFRSLKIHVEPIIFLTTFCNVAINIVKPHLTEMKMRRTYSHPEGTDEEIKKFYNKWMVTWDQNYDYVNMPIACIVGILYGAYGDVRGRKMPILLGIVSMLLGNIVNILMWSEKVDIALQWSYLSAVLCGLLGDYFMIMGLANAYLSDIFSNKHALGYRMIIASVCVSSGTLCTSWATKFLVDRFGDLAALYMAQVGAAAILCFAVCVVERKEHEPSRLSVLEICKNGFISVYESLKIFFIRREDHRRLFLWICLLANFLNEMTFGEQKGLIGTFTRLPPFNWGTDQFAVYKAVRPVYMITGSLFGLIVLRRYLRFRDTSLIILSTVSLAIFVIALGLARVSWIVFIALVPGGFHGLLAPLTTTFITCLIKNDEVGKVLAINMIVGKLAGVAETAILQNIYKSTLDWYPGFVWLVMGGISLFSALLYLFVHVVARREKIGPEYDRKEKNVESSEPCGQRDDVQNEA